MATPDTGMIEAVETTEVEPDAPVDEAEPVEPADDEEHDEEPDEEPGDEQLRQEAQHAAAQTEQEIARINNALSKEAKRHASRVVEIMQADADILEMCPLCLPLIPGFRYPSPPVAEQLAAVKEAIGEPATPEYKPDELRRVCEACDGLGAVKTGSRVANQAVVRCGRCSGNGWLSIGGDLPPTVPLDNGGAPPVVDYNPPPPGQIERPEETMLKQMGAIVVWPIQPEPGVPS